MGRVSPYSDVLSFSFKTDFNKTNNTYICGPVIGNIKRNNLYIYRSNNPRERRWFPANLLYCCSIIKYDGKWRVSGRLCHPRPTRTVISGMTWESTRDIILSIPPSWEREDSITSTTVIINVIPVSYKSI